LQSRSGRGGEEKLYRSNIFPTSYKAETESKYLEATHRTKKYCTPGLITMYNLYMSVPIQN